MSRLTRCAVPALICAAVSVASAVPASASAASCDVGNTRGYGTTYVTVIGTSGVTCAKGKTVVRAFHKCRPGKQGRCARAGKWTCSERRYNSSAQSYDSDVTCKRGGRKVTHTYTQFI